MNFNLLSSAVHFIFTCILFCNGVFLLALPWAPKVRIEIAHFFLNRSDILFVLGMLTIGTALLLFAGFFLLHRRRFARLKMEPSYAIDTSLMKNLLGDYWKKRFPKEELSVDVMVHPGPKLECLVEVPPLDSEAFEALFTEVEQDLGALLTTQIGYRGKFLVTAIEK